MSDRLQDNTMTSKGVVYFIAVLLIASFGCHSESKMGALTNESQELSVETITNIRNFCGDCHPMPVPESFPKSAWHDEVKRGFEFYYSSGRSDLIVPTVSDTHQYFVKRAPETLPLSTPGKVDKLWEGRFKRLDISIEGVDDATISFVDVVAIFGEQRGLLFSDMRHGGIYWAAIHEQGQIEGPRKLGEVTNPAVVRVCDWDGDGRKDLIASDLGSFLPEDHNRGGVVWLRQKEDESFESHTLIDDIGRVASVEIADFNRDGRQDILVAEFGWQKTGSIFWLERGARNHPTESLIKRQIDARSGAIHLPLADLNEDGAIDFVVLISQHHERVEAMLNDGKGNFQSELIYAGPEPSFGSSGIELVDFNRDGKLDVLFTNGDSFDSFILKPSHGVRWLENQGAYPFVEHEIGKMPGAHRALTCDLDGDGKKEVVVGAFLPRSLLKAQALREAEGLTLWTSQNGRFEKHVLTTTNYCYAAINVSDLNGDGCDELIVGHFRDGGTGPALTIWQNKSQP